MISFNDLKAAVADLARPFTFYSLATASSVAIAKMGWSIGEAIAAGKADGYQAAALAGVVLAGASAIYIGKSFENRGIASSNAEVEKIRAQANPPPAEALKPPAQAEDDGALPPDQRVRL
jgi:hypothetical protein